MPSPTALVLAGGNALGAYHGGVYEALHEGGLRPDWIIGTSIGALIAGNVEGRRLEALQTFWSMAALRTGGRWGSHSAASNEVRRLYGQAVTMLFGRPAVFAPNFAWLLAREPSAIGLYSLAPLQRSLESLIDFEVLNRGEIRFSAVATDLATGDEVLFDTREAWVGPEHIVASCGLIPDFRPIGINGRLFGDGGFTENQPLDVVRREPGRGGLCIAVDLFGAAAHPFNTLIGAALRREALFFANQSRRLLDAHEREDRLREALRAVLDLLPGELQDHPASRAAREAAEPDFEVIRLTWDSSEEPGNYLYDYSDVAVGSRWRAGRAAAARALQPVLERRQTGASA